MPEPERYGSYLVYEQIGRGGMASVHRAEQPLRGGGVREVALKRLLPTLKKELVTLFLDEARLLHYLDHPNIAATYDSGRVFGTYFIAMEYVPGPTLKQLVEHTGATVGAVPQPITLDIAAQLCDALDHAHTRCDENGQPLNIVHRDVTPANLILSPDGTLKLIDFGLAKAQVSTERTSAGVIKGKFGYVAPEYLAGHLDRRVDLWAVGIIMYELLTSRRLFDGPDALETMMRVKALPIPRPSIANPTVSPELDEIVMTALERDPSRRWQSAAQMRDRLRALLDDQFPGDRQVASWVSWVFTQERGARVPQMTPVMPAPILRPTPPTIEPELPTRPGPTPTPPAAPHLPDPRLATSMVNLPTAPMPEPRTLAIWIGVAVAVITLLVVISRLV